MTRRPARKTSAEVSPEAPPRSHAPTEKPWDLDYDEPFESSRMSRADEQAIFLVEAYGRLEAMVQAGRYRKVKTRKSWVCQLCDAAFDAGSESYDVSSRLLGRVKICLTCVQEQGTAGRAEPNG